VNCQRVGEQRRGAATWAYIPLSRSVDRGETCQSPAAARPIGISNQRLAVRQGAYHAAYRREGSWKCHKDLYRTPAGLCHFIEYEHLTTARPFQVHAEPSRGVPLLPSAKSYLHQYQIRLITRVLGRRMEANRPFKVPARPVVLSLALSADSA
jgi:hypothetical protein